MHTMTFLQKLYAKELVKTDLILMSDVWARVSLMFIAHEGTLGFLLALECGISWV